MNIFIRITSVALLMAMAAGPLAAKSAADPVEAKTTYQVLKTVKLGGEGSWDYLTIDSSARRLYVGRSNRVMVVDIDADKIVGGNRWNGRSTWYYTRSRTAQGLDHLRQGEYRQNF